MKRRIAQAIGCGGIGAIHLPARHAGLIDAIDAEVQVLNRHLPYHESDHRRGLPPPLRE